MKKTTVTIQYDESKLNGIKFYLDKKGLDIEDELSKSLDTLYNKVVPVQVREYIAMQNGEMLPVQAKPKSRKPAKAKENAKENS